MRKYTKKITGFLSGVSLIGLYGGGFVSPSMAADEAGFSLEEIVVTAQKRAESLQDVPVAITALSVGAIERNRVVSIEGISRIATSVNWQQGLTASNSTVSMRGFGTNAFGVGVESSVAIVQDNVVLSRQNEAFGELFNLERVEVLRGPQGTLFGKNASAGVIHLITKGPSEELEGKADVFYGSFNETVVRGTVSGPLSDSGKVAGRISAFYKSVDGNILNKFDGKKLNGIRDSYGVRGKLAIEVNDKLSLMVIADYSKTKTDCCAEPIRSLPANTNAFGVGALNINDAVVGINVGPNNREVSLDAPTFGNYTSWGLSNEANYDLEGVTFTSITSYREWEEETNADIDWSPLKLFLSNGGKKTQKTFTQELRVASSTDDPLQWIFGMFYYNNRNVQDFNRDFGGGRGQFLDSTLAVDNYAAFGEVKYKFETGTQLIAGARWQKEELKYTAIVSRTGFNTADNPNIPNSFNDSDAMLKLGIQQDIGDDAMAYFTFSQGYKGQAVDLTTGLSAAKAALQPIAAERVDSYEVGLKAEFMDRRLSFNVAAFLSNFSNFQTQAFDDAALTFRILNAGEVRSKGIEVETLFAATEELTFIFNATFQNIEILNIVGTGCFPGQTEPQGCVSRQQSISGGTLPNAPDTKIFVGANYEAPVGNGDFIGYTSLNYSWQSEVQYSLNQNPLTIQDSYGTANFSIGVRNADTGLKITAFINNIFDKSYVTGLRAPGGIWGGSTGVVQQIPRTADRTYGVRVGYSF
ncbi:TonB-dependent receptor [hydrothermal vent metagenome]|uniref:TonB-dependent receptor n=1 Tax=hydrothermal vent metagenome TaxID=652676 RepID=A0A3B0R311_9ZZZZ